jgi:hypothetical protein
MVRVSSLKRVVRRFLGFYPSAASPLSYDGQKLSGARVIGVYIQRMVWSLPLLSPIGRVPLENRFIPR